MALHIIDHPLVQHKLTHIRDEKTDHKNFRELVEEVAVLLAYEATHDLPMEEVEIKTPIRAMKSKVLAGYKPAIVLILRAGMGMATSLMKFIPFSRTGVIGLYRDEKLLKPVKYYCKLPPDIQHRTAILVDPMLATGYSAVAAVDILKENGVTDIRFLSVLSTPEGVAVLTEKHPDVEIYTAALDDGLTETGYINPGLGDAGDRIFGTK